ncbi:fibronectin type III domain-containing protein [Anaerolineae bacterium CFX7]|nr:fibronectin type III domain-containing protein [Anaerolineae bacterium CFX7]
MPTNTPSATPCTGKPGREIQVSPNNNANLFVRAVPLAWQGDPCKQTSKIIVKYDNKKGARVLKKKALTDNTFTTPKLNKGRTYVWKVRSCNAQGCGKWSGWRTFKVVKKAK